jgi:hypothetical protein
MRRALAFLVIALVSVAETARADEASSSSETDATGTTKWNSPALGVTGIALAGSGALAVTFGALMAARPSEMCVVDNDDTRCELGPERAIGGVMIAGGGVLLLAGVPMIVAGAWQVPSDERGVPPTTAELRVGASRADLAVSF